MSDQTIEPASFLSESQRQAMSAAKRFWHQSLADGGIETEVAVTMMGQAIHGVYGFDPIMSGRIGLRLMLQSVETLFDIAIEDAKRAGLPYDDMIAARDRAIADRVASEEAAPAERPKPTLVQDAAND